MEKFFKNAHEAVNSFMAELDADYEKKCVFNGGLAGMFSGAFASGLAGILIGGFTGGLAGILFGGFTGGFFGIDAGRSANEYCYTTHQATGDGIIRGLFCGLFYMFLAGTIHSGNQHMYERIKSACRKLPAEIRQEAYPECMVYQNFDARELEELKQILQEDIPKATKDCQDTPPNKWSDRQRAFCSQVQ